MAWIWACPPSLWRACPPYVWRAWRNQRLGSDEAEKITVICPHCGQQLRAPTCVAGQEALCPQCKGTLHVPTATGNIPVSKIEGADWDATEAAQAPPKPQEEPGMTAWVVVVLGITFVMILAGSGLLPPGEHPLASVGYTSLTWRCGCIGCCMRCASGGCAGAAAGGGGRTVINRRGQGWTGGRYDR